MTPDERYIAVQDENLTGGSASETRSIAAPSSEYTDRRGGTEDTDRVSAGSPDYVNLVEDVKDTLRTEARNRLGFATGGDTRPLRDTIRESGAGWYPLLALSLLVIVDEFQGYGFLVLGPEVSRSLGVSPAGLGAILALKTLVIMLATLPMAAFVQRTPRRALASVVTAFLWSLFIMGTAFVANVWGLMAVMLADGASTGSVRSLHQPLLMDSYPPEARVRVFSTYRAADMIGNILAPALVGGLTALLGFNWRGVFLVMGLASLVAVLTTIRLRDPGFGRWDEQRVRRLVDDTTGEPGAGDADVSLGFFEIARRLLLIPTIRRVLAGWAVLGMLLVPLYTYLFFFLEDRWGMGPGARGFFFAVIPIFSIAALYLFGPWGERTYRERPDRLQQAGGIFLGVGVVTLAAAIFTPVFGVMVVLFGIGFSLLALMQPMLYVTMLSLVPPAMRAHTAALAGIFLAGVGGFGGLLLLGGLDRRFGTGGAIASLALPGIGAAFVLWSASRTVVEDLDRNVDRIVEDQEIKDLVRRGVRIPMLACRKVEFAYGQVQVLFGVDFTVDDGEMVALLGTNGAGKSTLLRVISGLGLPVRGTIRYGGADITYMDAERRLALGIANVPGGRSVFGRLSVVENLRLYGYSLRRDRKAMHSGIETAFDRFPRLGERRNQPAGLLSGGEQQMLALSKALILKPRLLLIDELSLGLAPRVVGELLDMVTLINQTGTAVVLVEQSVNVALSAVDHAYFMEKGTIRFDGRSSELLGRRDLLRSVFLKGADSALDV